MKTLIATLFAATAVSQAAVTLQFTITPNAAAGWADGSGATNSLLVWGVLVDSGGDGFDGLTFTNFDGGSLATTGDYDSGVSTASNLSGTALSSISTSLATDDFLFVPTVKMSTGGTFDNATGLSKITSISNMVYSGNIAAGDSYAIIWFNQTANGATADGLKYGVYRESWMTLPADPGTYNVSSNFVGDESTKSMNLTLGVAVPEPSAALLGALGVLGLLRRRRI